jgi:PIN domain nuclease of toxin-antitoxin system
MQTLLDTHAWIWWVTGDKRLSRKAKQMIETAAKSGELLLSMISVWELAKRVEKNQLILDRNIDVWLDQAINSQQLQTIELTRSILVESCRLPQPFHGDPADQIIVATCRVRGAAIVSKDQKIRKYRFVQSVW